MSGAVVTGGKASLYRELNAGEIVGTTEALCRRIAERFPDSDLRAVGQELLAVARATPGRVEELRQPNWAIRFAIGVALLVLFVLVAAGVYSLFRLQTAVPALADLLQGLEAAVNNIIFISIGVFFLLTVETRLKRRKALRSVHELRSVAHIIDMHQLTKDPESVVSPARATPSSPERALGRFELARYLDYCSEALSITSKLAALYAQHFNDPVILNAVNDVETLAQGFSVKIWQKIMILDTVSLPAAAAE